MHFGIKIGKRHNNIFLSININLYINISLMFLKFFI